MKLVWARFMVLFYTRTFTSVTTCKYHALFSSKKTFSHAPVVPWSPAEESYDCLFQLPITGPLNRLPLKALVVRMGCSSSNFHNQTKRK